MWVTGIYFESDTCVVGKRTQKKREREACRALVTYGEERGTAERAAADRPVAF